MRELADHQQAARRFYVHQTRQSGRAAPHALAPGRMSVTAAAAGAACGALAALTGPLLLRQLPASTPGVRRQYQDLAASRGAQLSRVVISTAVCGALAARLGWSAVLPVWVFLGAFGTLLAGIDWRTHQLPAALVDPSLLVTVAGVTGTSIVTSDHAGLMRTGVGWALAGASFGAIWLVSPRSLGFGDVRLGALLGLALAWLGAALPVQALFLSLVLAAASGLALRVTTRLSADRTIPLGPFLVAGAVLAVLFRQP